MIVPFGRLVILRSVAKSEMIAALAWLTIPALLGPVIRPPLGGFITTYLHWRWIFYINLPIGVLGLVLTWNFITNVKEEHAPPLDKTGFALSGLGLSAFVFGLAILGETGGSLSPLCLGGSGPWPLRRLCMARQAHRKPGDRSQPAEDSRPSGPVSWAPRSSGSGWAPSPFSCR